MATKATTYQAGVEYDARLRKTVKYRGATLRPAQSHRILDEMLNGPECKGAIDDAKPTQA